MMRSTRRARQTGRREAIPAALILGNAPTDGSTAALDAINARNAGGRRRGRQARPAQSPPSNLFSNQCGKESFGAGPGGAISRAPRFQRCRIHAGERFADCLDGNVHMVEQSVHGTSDGLIHHSLLEASTLTGPDRFQLRAASRSVLHTDLHARNLSLPVRVFKPQTTVCCLLTWFSSIGQPQTREMCCPGVTQHPRQNEVVNVSWHFI